VAAEAGLETALRWIGLGASACAATPSEPAAVPDLLDKVLQVRTLARPVEALEELVREAGDSEALHRLVLDSLSEAVFVVDRDLRVVLFNRGSASVRRTPIARSSGRSSPT